MGVPSLIEHAWRLEPFRPPFAFSDFFSPEDTLLCACAADAAVELFAGPTGADAPTGVNFAELTSGSGLVGFHLLRREPSAKLLGFDIDPRATLVAEQNARVLGLGERARFIQSDLWSDATRTLLEAERPDLLVCNPPYVPEPAGTKIQVEAGAGPHGSAHLLRALELTRMVKPETLALSWCSLSEPAAIVAVAEESGYELQKLFVTAIADGEYSGSVHSYLQKLRDCYINEGRETLDTLGPDGSARFGYLLFAAAFRRGTPSGAAATVDALCVHFQRDGVRALANIGTPLIDCSILSRWDELKLRVMLHGEVPQASGNPE